MLLRMKVLLVTCLCIVPAVARPSSSTASAHATATKTVIPPTSYPSETGTQNTKREASATWRPISHARSHSIFRVINVPSSHSYNENSYEMNDIPSETLSLFIPPEFPSKEARQLRYFASTPEVPVPGHLHRLLHEAPFFDTIDHAKPVLALQQRRKYAGLAPLVLKSIRPYFPFFSYE